MTDRLPSQAASRWPDPMAVAAAAAARAGDKVKPLNTRT